MTQSEFILISSFDKPKLHKLVLGLKFDAAMRFRRELQQAMTLYAKGKQGKLDHIQHGGLEATRQIESWCRQAFYTRRMREILKQTPSLLLQGKKPVKWQVKKEWETLAERLSY